MFSKNHPKVKTNHLLGSEGEDLATHYLKKEGYRVLERNFRTRFGELDIVAEKNREYFFVEVKTRKTSDYGSPQEAIPFYRLERLKKMGSYYATVKKIFNRNLHLSLVGIDWSLEPPKIIFIKDICE